MLLVKNIYLFDIRLYSLTQGLIINVYKHISECCYWHLFLILNAMYYKKEINSKEKQYNIKLLNDGNTSSEIAKIFLKNQTAIRKGIWNYWHGKNKKIKSLVSSMS